MSIIVAGGAGFIGCHLVRHFLEHDQPVLVIDNFCRGSRDFLKDLPGQAHLHIVAADLADVESTIKIVGDFHRQFPVETVWHMAANSDIPAGIANSQVDFRDTFLTTYALLEAMKIHGVRRLAFASSSAIYGDHGAQTLLREDSGPLFPISNYGAMKLASEAAISAAVESHLERAWIFRFPNVIGVPATHGVLLDFVRKLRADPTVLPVLGDGTQQKVYLHVEELIRAMLFIVANATAPRNCYNVGPGDDGVRVSEIAEDVVAGLAPGARILYGKEGRGWVGDVPRFKYSVERLRQLGFSARLSSREAVRQAIAEIAHQEGCVCHSL